MMIYLVRKIIFQDFLSCGSNTFMTCYIVLSLVEYKKSEKFKMTMTDCAVNSPLTRGTVPPYRSFCNSFCSKIFLYSSQVVWVRITKAETKTVLHTVISNFDCLGINRNTPFERYMFREARSCTQDERELLIF